MTTSIDTLKRLSWEQRKFFLLFGLLCLGILVGISFVYLKISDILREQAERRSYLLAQTASDKDIIMRKWVSGLGGIYAPVTPATPPNPWLPEAGRDFTLPGGMRITRMNPAYVTRLVHELWREHSDIPSRIVSAKPVNPANRALPWEAAALGEIERRGGKEYFILSQDPEKGETLRYMAALRVEQSCLTCHTTQGYKVGDIIGGISSEVATSRMATGDAAIKRTLLAGFSTAGVVVLLLFLWGGYALLQNIVKRNRAEEELRLFAATLESKVEQRTSDLQEAEKNAMAAKEQAEEASRAKSDFLARMSHEIRTPMNGILGMTYLCLQSTQENKQIYYLHKILTAGRGLLGIINDILDVSKIEAGKMSLSIEPFPLQELLENLSDLCGALVDNKNIEVLFHIDPKLFITVEGDLLRLTQVLTNFLSNAIKFTAKGQVVLRIEELGREDKTITLRMSVSDTGIGLTEEELLRLFKPFEQADGSITRKYGGTGLGLVICQRFVQMMGGEIEVRSAPGQGSVFTFTLTLPYRAAQNMWDDPDMVATERLLVVDDCEDARMIIQDILVRFGFRVDAVASGQEALDRILRASEAGAPYSLVLLDWKMPAMGGMEVADSIHKLPLGTVPHLLMISAHGLEAYQEQGQGLNFAGFLVKPVNPVILWNAILQALGKKAALPRLAGMEEAGGDALAARHGTHVLLVEDNEINQEVASRLMERMGMQVTLAENGLDAVNACKVTKFDIIFMDIQMPIMDGLEAARLLREQEAENGAARTPIVAMTAHAMQENKDKSLAAGMDDHITKPIAPDTLSKILIKWTAPRQQAPKEAAAAKGGKATESPSLPTPEGAPDNTAVFNWGKGLHYVGGEEESLVKHLKNFTQRYVDTPQKLTEFSAAGQWHEASRAAHSLKGVAATLGMDALSACAAALEQSYAANTADGQSLEKLRELLQRAGAEIKQNLKEKGFED